MEKYQEAYDKASEAYTYGREHSGSATFQEMAKSLAKEGSALYKMKKYEEAMQKLRDSMLEFRDKQTLALLNKIEDEYNDFKLKQQYNPEQALECKNEGNALVRDKKY